MSPKIYSLVKKETCENIYSNGLNITHVVAGITYGGQIELNFREVSTMYYVFLKIEYRIFNLKFQNLEDTISKNFQQILVTSYAKFLGMSSTDEWLNISEDEEKIAFNFIKNLEVNLFFKTHFLPL